MYEFTPEDRQELIQQAEAFGQLCTEMRGLQTFILEALYTLSAEDVPDDWASQYEQKLHMFMVNFAGKFADAPSKEKEDGQAEATGSGAEVREELEAPGSEAGQDR